MRILIVDDEIPARARLRAQVEELGGPFQVAGEAGDGADALEQCSHGGIDLVLMDIRMPRLDGLEAAARLAEFPAPPAVIFVTAYEQHALEAFDRSAVGYLLKPVRKERLLRALERASSLTRPQLKSLEELRGGEGAGEFLTVRTRGGLRRIPLEEIFFFQADQKYVTVRHSGGEELLEDSLKRLEERYGDRFIRIHRNALVSCRHLTGLEKGRDSRLFAVLRGLDQRLEVSRRHVAAVRGWLAGEAA